MIEFLLISLVSMKWMVGNRGHKIQNKPQGRIGHFPQLESHLQSVIVKKFQCL